MKISVYPCGYLAANCYILDDENGHFLVIDPGSDSEKQVAQLRENGQTLDAILITHAHFDHLGGLRKIKRVVDVPVYLHEADLEIGEEMAPDRLCKTLPYPETLTIGNFTFTVYHTPGHSPGSVCLQTGKLLFTGDTLFAGTCGRVDLAGGNMGQMRQSLAFLASLPDDLRVLPGHGEETTLGVEKAVNPYLRGVSK